MKKLFLLLVMSLAFIGCSSDDEPVVQVEALIQILKTNSWEYVETATTYVQMQGEELIAVLEPTTGKVYKKDQIWPRLLLDDVEGDYGFYDVYLSNIPTLNRETVYDIYMVFEAGYSEKRTLPDGTFEWDNLNRIVLVRKDAL